MKTLPRYMIFSYIGPFLMTFFISVFVLFLQFLWKYVDDLIGKGLGTPVLAELFFYAALTTFPLALPLAILLSSLMTFGNLGEHFELVALKSAGMSLQKIMMPLVIVAFFTSVGAFFFSNYTLPYVNLKWQSLIYDIQQKKPAFNIKEGVFYNGIEGYTIRVEKKDDDGITCHNIMIYDHTQNMGNNKVITAEYGKLEFTSDNQFLLLDLFNGTSFEEMVEQKNSNNYPFVRNKFKEQTVRFDLSGFRLKRSDEGIFKSNYAMMNIGQISKEIDSINIDRQKDISDFRKTFSDKLLKKIFSDSIKKQPKTTSPIHTFGSLKIHSLKKAPAQNSGKSIPTANEEKARMIDAALSEVRSEKYMVDNLLTQMKNYDFPTASLSVEWHKKFTLSIACLILFFVGAPLGAIIRKGGLGMPVVVSVIIFIFFWIITITGEKMVQESVLPAYIGMWIASAVTLPFGIFLTIKATSDSSLFDASAYLKFFQKLFRKQK